MGNEYYIDKATPPDLPAILSLVQTEYEYPYTSPEYWQWRYFGNPVADVSVFVARDHRGQIAAMQPVSAYSMSVQGEARRVYILTGAITHPEHRRRGLFRRLVEAIEQDLSTSPDLFIFTFPNEQSARGFERFRSWHLREYLELFVRPLPSPRLLTSLVQYIARPATERPASVELEPAPPLEVGALEITPILSFHEELSSLMQRSPLSSARFIERTAEYLNWRYIASPVSRYLVYQAVAGDSIEGYLVMKGATLYGLRAGLIVDLVAADHQTARHLLNQAVRTAQASGLDVLGYTVGDFRPYIAALRKAGFVRIPQRLLPRKFYVYTFPHPPSASNTLAQTLALVPWYTVWGDTDVV